MRSEEARPIGVPQSTTQVVVGGAGHKQRRGDHVKDRVQLFCSYPGGLDLPEQQAMHSPTSQLIL